MDDIKHVKAVLLQDQRRGPTVSGYNAYFAVFTITTESATVVSTPISIISLVYTSTDIMSRQ